MKTQRWSERRHSFRPERDSTFSPGLHDVEPLDELTAKAFVEQHHYAGRYPSSNLRYGLYRGGRLAGVAVLTNPFTQAVLTNAFPALEPYRESLELGRFVLLDEVERNGESWFLSRVFHLAAQEGIRGIVSFSDPVPRMTTTGRVVMPGHVGIIYQASNAVYAGRGTPRTLSLLPDGTIFSEEAKGKIRKQTRGAGHCESHLVSYGASPRLTGEEPSEWMRRSLAALGVRAVRHHGNHRYLFTVGNRRDRRTTVISFPSLPYPKTIAA